MASFAEDVRGHWYCKIGIEIVESAPREAPTVAIEPGLKDLARLSEGLQGGARRSTIADYIVTKQRPRSAAS
jgi:hypothetical protein